MTALALAWAALIVAGIGFLALAHSRILVRPSKRGRG